MNLARKSNGEQIKIEKICIYSIDKRVDLGGIEKNVSEVKVSRSNDKRTTVSTSQMLG
jgi:hypothetical protein